jgi:fido (protein-threonine AMPylation protein)
MNNSSRLFILPLIAHPFLAGRFTSAIEHTQQLLVHLKYDFELDKVLRLGVVKTKQRTVKTFL